MDTDRHVLEVCTAIMLTAYGDMHAGLLALRTVAITATFALATAMAARSDVAHAASHQICLQMWLASSLLADALAVAAQTLVARLLAGGRAESARV